MHSREKARPILIPLPFFAAEKDVQSVPFRQQKVLYCPPHVYGPKNTGKMQSVTLACPAAAVINFNPLGQRGMRNGAATGTIVGVQSRCSTGKLAIVAALPGQEAPPPSPYSFVTSTKDSTAPMPPLFEANNDLPVGGLTKVDSGTLEVESVGSEGTERNGSQTIDQNENLDAVSPSGEEPGGETEKTPQGSSSCPMLNLTTEEGENGGVEIYSATERGICCFLMNSSLFSRNIIPSEESRGFIQSVEITRGSLNVSEKYR